MGWIIGMIFAVVVCGIAYLVGRSLQKEAKKGLSERTGREVTRGDDTGEWKPEDVLSTGKWIKRGALIAFVLWVGIWSLLATIKQVGAGEVGVVYQFGAIISQRSEGLQLIAPWQSLDKESIQVQRHTFEGITAFSSENQDVFIKATINYSVSPGAVQTLRREVGSDWFDRLIEPRINNFLKEETVRYTTVTITPQREAIRLAVRNRLAQDLAQYSINVDDFLIDNIDFDQSFKDAINAKQVALQQIETEKNKVKIADQQAMQKASLAQGDANALRITAQGQAEANKLLAQSLTPEVIQFQALQKLGDNIQIALIPSGQGIILDPATLLGLKPSASTTPTPTVTASPTPSPTPSPTETTETPEPTETEEP